MYHVAVFYHVRTTPVSVRALPKFGSDCKKLLYVRLWFVHAHRKRPSWLPPPLEPETGSATYTALHQDIPRDTLADQAEETAMARTAVSSKPLRHRSSLSQVFQRNDLSFMTRALSVVRSSVLSVTIWKQHLCSLRLKTGFLG